MVRRALKKLCCEDYLGNIIQCNRGPCRSKCQCHRHFPFNWPVNIIFERSVSKLYLMVCTFVQPAFNYSPQAPPLSVRHQRKTPLGIKWRWPSSRIKDFCRSDIFPTALLLCSKLQLESLFGKDHLTGREMISAHICRPRPRPDSKSNFIPSRSTVQHFHSLLQEHHLGPGLLLGHLPEDRRLSDEH